MEFREEKLKAIKEAQKELMSSMRQWEHLSLEQKEKVKQSMEKQFLQELEEKISQKSAKPKEILEVGAEKFAQQIVEQFTDSLGTMKTALPANRVQRRANKRKRGGKHCHTSKSKN